MCEQSLALEVPRSTTSTPLIPAYELQKDYGHPLVGIGQCFFDVLSSLKKKTISPETASPGTRCLNAFLVSAIRRVDGPGSSRSICDAVHHRLLSTCSPFLRQNIAAFILSYQLFSSGAKLRARASSPAFPAGCLFRVSSHVRLRLRIPRHHPGQPTHTHTRMQARPVLWFTHRQCRR